MRRSACVCSAPAAVSVSICLGSRIAGVDITIRADEGDPSRTVHATVRDGYFIAWYPEGRDEANSNTTTLALRLDDGGSGGVLSAGELIGHPHLG